MDVWEVEALRRRITRLERRLALGATSLFVAVIVVSTLGMFTPQAASQTDIIRARGVEIQDSDGNVRIALSTYADGTAEVVFNDKAGKGRMWMNIRPDGTPSVVLADNTGRGRIWLASFADQSSGIVLSDIKGRGRVWLGASENEGGSNLVLINTKGQVQFKVP